MRFWPPPRRWLSVGVSVLTLRPCTGYASTMGFVYRKDGSTYRVGFYDPEGNWNEDSAFPGGLWNDSKAHDKAVDRVRLLNGGN